jgi:hypothetical protein
VIHGTICTFGVLIGACPAMRFPLLLVKNLDRFDKRGAFEIAPALLVRRCA